MSELDNIKPTKNKYREIDSTIPGARMFLQLPEQNSVAVGIEAGRWHLSIANRMRYPSWHEITRARYDLLPKQITMAMLLPPPDQYVNVHDNCFHLWEILTND